MASATSEPAVKEADEQYAGRHASGMILFASVLLVMLGCVNVIYGIAAIANSHVFASHAHYVFGDLRFWGWITLTIGVLQLLAAAGVLRGSQLARWFGVAVVGLNAINQMLFIPAFPAVSLVIIAVDVVALYGLCIYGRRRPTRLASAPSYPLFLRTSEGSGVHYEKRRAPRGVIRRSVVSRRLAPRSVVPQPRRLQATVQDADGNRRSFAFSPGQLHTLSVRIAPGNKGIVADREFRDSEVRFDHSFGAELDVEIVVDAPAGTVIDRKPMILPSHGPSTTVEVEIDVASDATEVRAAVLIFQRATLLQSAQLRGPVLAEDKPRNGDSIRLVVDTPTAPEAAPARAEVDASISFHVGRPGEALLVAEGTDCLLTLGSLTTFRDRIIQTLRFALDVDDVEGAQPGSAQQVELLRRLARHGYTLYQELAGQCGIKRIGQRIQLISAPDDIVPIEFVYDFGLPSKTAKLCSHWQKALATGSCNCKPREGKVNTICPLGFWGLRYIIERQVASTKIGGSPADPAGQLRLGHETLPVLDRVLFAATTRVDKVNHGERERTLKLLTDRLGDGVTEATSWQRWRRTVRKRKPGVLLSLPHAEIVDDLPALQIGISSVQELAAMTKDYVVAPGSDVGPMVLLLGCSTATDAIQWQSAVAAFRRLGASVVVGTLVETLGRQTAPLARHFAEQMWGPTRAQGQTIGEVLQELRRHSVASGATLGMSLVAFGQSGWLVPAPED
jgi:hypothetical protein